MHDSASAADLHFYFDPVCPFGWMTSKWVRMVAARRRYRVDWRFISLRLLNAHVDYAAHFPPEYEAGHTAGLRLLRVAARRVPSTDPTPSDGSTRRSAPRSSTPSASPDAADATARGARGVRRAGAGRGRAARRACRRAGRPGVGRDRADGDRRGARAHRQGRRHADTAFRAPGRRGLLRPGDQPPARRGRGGASCGTTWSRSRGSRGSPSSSAACASCPSCAPSGWRRATWAWCRSGRRGVGGSHGDRVREVAPPASVKVGDPPAPLCRTPTSVRR